VSPYRTPPKETKRDENVVVSPDRPQRWAMLVVAFVAAIRLALAISEGRAVSTTSFACAALVAVAMASVARRPRTWVVRIRRR
jgi:hypothetical protein